MNIEDFVTYEQALALKKLGFDERCLYYYNVNEQIVANERDYQEEVSVKDLYISYNSEYTSYNRIDAPTLAQVQKWLRKEKHYYIECLHIIANNWTYEISNNNGSVKYDAHMLAPYEEALSAGIMECLKLLKE